MAKKKKPQNKLSLENDLAGLNKLIQNQNFDNIEELQGFLDSIVGKRLDDIVPKKKGRKNKQEKAQELVFEALDMDPTQGRKQIKEALALDPNNVDAWIYMAETSESPETGLEYYKKALKAGKKNLGEKAFEELKGHFWGFHDTRPYMKAKAGIAFCLTILDEHEEAIRHYQEMLELNPNDNQGIRYDLSLLLVENQKHSAYDKLYNAYSDDATASWQYTYALNSFIRAGKTPQSDKALKTAYETNPHVLKLLSGEKEMPEELPEFMGFGDENEAIHYVRNSVGLWIEVPGVLDWVFDFYRKWKNIN